MSGLTAIINMAGPPGPPGTTAAASPPPLQFPGSLGIFKSGGGFVQSVCVPVNMTLTPANCFGFCASSAQSTGTATCTFTNKAGQTVATMTFTPGSSNASVSVPIPNLIAGDVISFFSPNPLDATLGRVACVLAP